MTLDEFKKKYPGCHVGGPSVAFPTGVVVVCVGVVVLMLKTLFNARFSQEDIISTVMGAVGALCLSVSFFAGAVLGAKRLLEVRGWQRSGRCSFAVAEEEALLIGEDGQIVLLPLAQVARLSIHIHSVRVEMQPGFAHQEALDRIVSRVLSASGDGPRGREFFKAMEPRVKRLSPHADIRNVEPDSLWTLIKNA